LSKQLVVVRITRHDSHSGLDLLGVMENPVIQNLNLYLNFDLHLWDSTPSGVWKVQWGEKRQASWSMLVVVVAQVETSTLTRVFKL